MEPNQGAPDQQQQADSRTAKHISMLTRGSQADNTESRQTWQREIAHEDRSGDPRLRGRSGEARQGRLSQAHSDGAKDVRGLSEEHDPGWDPGHG